MKHDIFILHEIFEELDAFCPVWQSKYATLPAAVADMLSKSPDSEHRRISELWRDFQESEEHQRRQGMLHDTPDYRSAVQSTDRGSLPFGYDNLADAYRAIGEIEND